MDPFALGLRRFHTPYQVWAILMETGFDGGAVASLVVVYDRTVSLYLSSGGGILREGEHEPVQRAANKLLEAASDSLDLLLEADHLPLPVPGQVRINARAFGGDFTTTSTEEALASGRHPLSHVFRAGHEVITQLMLFDDQREKREHQVSQAGVSA